MTINVNKTNRIVSSRYEWTHEVLQKAKAKDGSAQWKIMGHYMDFDAAVNGMVALKIRMIPDSAETIREIQAYLVEIRGMAKQACDVFRVTT